MARTVNPQEYADKRKDILDAAQRLVFAKGYERMTIQDILAGLGISSGAFYHYFPTKPAVLEALIERMQEEAEEPLLPIVQDASLPATGKLRRFFATLDRLRMAQRTFLTGLLRVWYTDDNAIVRQKVDEATLSRRGPLLAGIVPPGDPGGRLCDALPRPGGRRRPVAGAQQRQCAGQAPAFTRTRACRAAVCRGHRGHL